MLNYEDYTNTELIDVRSTMDPSSHPENYRALMKEIEKRGTAIRESEIEREKSFHVSLRMKKQVVG